MDEQLSLLGDIITAKEGMCRLDIEDSVVSLLRDIPLETLVSYLTNKYEQTVEYYLLSNGADTCKKMSLLFNPHRLDTNALNSPYSIYGAIRSKENFLPSLARAMSVRFNESKGSCRDILYRAFQFGAISGVKYINEFPPKVARDLCLKYGVFKNSSVLDPCAGWGGRMIGVSTVCDRYVCYEPSTRTYNGLLELEKFIRSMSRSFSAEVNCLPFEDSNLDEGSFDFALTSPPYYDTENYSDEETNSKNRYSSFDDWCKFFFLPLVQKTMDALKEGHVFVLNIGSRIYPLNEVLMDNFASKYQIKKHKSLLSGNGGGYKKRRPRRRVFLRN